jgi:hypothetical protein
MSTTPNPFMDHAAPILAGEPSITDSDRESLWDAFHSKSSEELVQHLAPLAVPDDLKRKLFDAKRASMPVAPPVDKVTEAVQRVAALDPKVLDVAESHPNILKAFTTAAATPEKPAQEAAGGASAAPKDNTAATAKKPAPLAQPPRADGQSHMPPIPEGHHRILASDGGIHDIPAENIEQARAIDPNMHVLNP